jgi:hypothetical protein
VCSKPFLSGQKIFKSLRGDGRWIHYRCTYLQQDVAELLEEVSRDYEELAVQKIGHNNG